MNSYLNTLISLQVTTIIKNKHWKLFNKAPFKIVLLLSYAIKKYKDFSENRNTVYYFYEPIKTLGKIEPVLDEKNRTFSLFDTNVLSVNKDIKKMIFLVKITYL